MGPSVAPAHRRSPTRRTAAPRAVWCRWTFAFFGAAGEVQQWRDHSQGPCCSSGTGSGVRCLPLLPSHIICCVCATNAPMGQVLPIAALSVCVRKEQGHSGWMESLDYIQTPLAIRVQSALAHGLFFFHKCYLGVKLHGETARRRASIGQGHAVNRRIGTEPKQQNKHTRFLTVGPSTVIERLKPKPPPLPLAALPDERCRPEY